MWLETRWVNKKNSPHSIGGSNANKSASPESAAMKNCPLDKCAPRKKQTTSGGRDRASQNTCAQIFFESSESSREEWNSRTHQKALIRKGAQEKPEKEDQAANVINFTSHVRKKKKNTMAPKP